MAGKLTPKMRAWLREYRVSRNATEACRKAGYKGSPGTLRRLGHQILHHPAVQAALVENEAKLEEEFQLTQERVIDELIDIGFGNIGDVLDWESDSVSLRPKKEMSKRGVGFIDSIRLERGMEKKKKGDDEELVPYVKELKITTLGKERVKALELLGKHVGLWKDGRSGTDQDAGRAILERLQKYFQKNRRDRSGGGA